LFCGVPIGSGQQAIDRWTPPREEQARTATDARKKMKIKGRKNKNQTLNYYAEKSEEPRLLRLEEKIQEKDDHQLKLKNDAI
jgi:hypothetical protein